MRSPGKKLYTDIEQLVTVVFSPRPRHPVYAWGWDWPLLQRHDLKHANHLCKYSLTLNYLTFAVPLPSKPSRATNKQCLLIFKDRLPG